jgi:hypothetical protein
MIPSVSAKRCVTLGRGLALKILMRRMIVVLIAALIAMGAGAFKIAAAEKCMIAILRSAPQILTATGTMSGVDAIQARLLEKTRAPCTRTAKSAKRMS